MITHLILVAALLYLLYEYRKVAKESKKLAELEEAIVEFAAGLDAEGDWTERFHWEIRA